MEDENQMPLWAAACPIVVLVSLLAINVWAFDDATGGANQLALLLAATVAGTLGVIWKVPYKKMKQGVIDGVSATTPALLVLFVIGALSGTWLISGIVPAMVYYGLQVMTPQWFLVATVIVCAVVSVATGSSWSTIATVGVALISIGKMLGIPIEMSAGAIISGAYFGDKISPLSDTTNLAAAMAGADLFAHIRYMLWTTVPSLIITLIFFAYLSTRQEVLAGGETAFELSTLIEQKFNLGWWLFAGPVVVLTMVMFKFDALVALIVGALLGGAMAIICQPHIVAEVGGESGNFAEQAYRAVVTALSSAVQLETGDAELNSLLGSSGMAGMLNTVWLILCAMCFGGVMEACGMLRRLTAPLVASAKSSGALVTSTAGTCLFLNLTASDQYLAIVVPGRMFRESYADRNLAAVNLSRTLEDSGTVTSVLVPWNTCGATQAGILKVGTLAFAPYCIFNITSPLMTLAFAWLGVGVKRRTENDDRPTG